MQHTISDPTPVPASGPGALAGFSALCSCGLRFGASLPLLARQEVEAHRRWAARQATRQQQQGVVVHTVKGRVTHRPVEQQGTSVLTGCGLLLEQGYSEMTAAFPTCKRCARRI